MLFSRQSCLGSCRDVDWPLDGDDDPAIIMVPDLGPLVPGISCSTIQGTVVTLISHTVRQTAELTTVQALFICPALGLVIASTQCYGSFVQQDARAYRELGHWMYGPASRRPAERSHTAASASCSDTLPLTWSV